MVGGDAEVFEAARPVFDTFGALVVHVGPLGAGQVLKLVNNAVFTAQVAITRDTLVVLGELGVEVGAGMRAIAASTGSSRCAELCVAGGSVHAFSRHSEGRRRGAELLAKDIGLVFDELGTRGVALPPDLDGLVRSGLRFAVDSGAAEADSGAGGT